MIHGSLEINRTEIYTIPFNTLIFKIINYNKFSFRYVGWLEPGSFAFVDCHLLSSSYAMLNAEKYENRLHEKLSHVTEKRACLAKV